LIWHVARLLAILHDPDDVPALDCLLEFQQPAARLLKPPGLCIDPTGLDCSMSLDQQGNFATAAAIGALNAAAP
jgi:hypothetical protein